MNHLHRPHVLGHVVDDINALIAHPSKSVRVQAYNLLLKYLRHSPKGPFTYNVRNGGTPIAVGSSSC